VLFVTPEPQPSQAFNVRFSPKADSQPECLLSFVVDVSVARVLRLPPWLRPLTRWSAHGLSAS
jgi:hypothetical protein